MSFYSTQKISYCCDAKLSFSGCFPTTGSYLLSFPELEENNAIGQQEEEGQHRALWKTELKIPMGPAGVAQLIGAPSCNQKLVGSMPCRVVGSIPDLGA